MGNVWSPSSPSFRWVCLCPRRFGHTECRGRAPGTSFPLPRPHTRACTTEESDGMWWYCTAPTPYKKSQTGSPPLSPFPTHGMATKYQTEWIMARGRKRGEASTTVYRALSSNKWKKKLLFQKEKERSQPPTLPQSTFSHT